MLRSTRAFELSAILTQIQGMEQDATDDDKVLRDLRAFSRQVQGVIAKAADGNPAVQARRRAGKIAHLKAELAKLE
jgi:hypothetical protein